MEMHAGLLFNKTATEVGLRLRHWWLEWRLERARPHLLVTFVTRSNFELQYVRIELKILG